MKTPPTQIPATFIVKNAKGEIWAEGVLFTNGEVCFLWRDVENGCTEDCEDLADFLDWFVKGDTIIWL